MSDDRDDAGIPWRDPAEGTLELIRAAREALSMTREEENRAVARVQQALASQRRAVTSKRRVKLALGGFLAAGTAAAAALAFLSGTPIDMPGEQAPSPDAPGPSRIELGVTESPLPAPPPPSVSATSRPDAGPARRRRRFDSDLPWPR